MELPADDQALLGRLPDSLRARNGVPDPEDGAARERAAEIVRRVVGDAIWPGGLRTSVLGPAWSRDLDVHVVALPDPGRLATLGWIRLDGLMASLGHKGAGRWAVILDGFVLALADFTTDVPPDRVSAVLERCRRRREVRVREVLELRALVRSGTPFPSIDPVLAVAAGVEEGLGGDLLAQWRGGPALSAPASLPQAALGPLWRTVKRLGSRMRPQRRVVVAVSGIDGAGKSTLANLLARDLRRVGLPVTSVWTRPGMGIGGLDRLAGMAKRVLRQNPTPGVKRIGRGERAESLTSRRGALGWAWSLLVVLAYLRGTRSRYRQGGGVVVFDRHLLDALVTLDVVYQGVGLKLQRTLVRRLLPKADLTLLLSVAAATALARKPADMFTQEVLEQQAERYAALRTMASHLRVLDGTRPMDELQAEAFRAVADIGSPR